MIKERLEGDLGLTFGVGLGPNKSIAKIASKHHKPAGFTAIPARAIHTYLKDLPAGSIWGLGGSTSLYLEKLGVRTALEFAQRDQAWLVANHISKPYCDIWMELNGKMVKKLNTASDDSIGSIMKTQTFTPPSSDRAFVLSQLAKNIEGACAKARRYKVKGRSLSFYLKTQDFTYGGLSLQLSVAVADPRECLRVVEEHFDEVFDSSTVYRATGFTLRSIVADHAATADLFGESVRVEEKAKLLTAVDALNRKFGRTTVHFGASMSAQLDADAHQKSRALRSRKKIALPIEQRRKTINIPYLGIAR
jgi:DNA polymerase-4/DNA polymerase V